MKPVPKKEAPKEEEKKVEKKDAIKDGDKVDAKADAKAHPGSAIAGLSLSWCHAPESTADFADQCGGDACFDTSGQVSGVHLRQRLLLPVLVDLGAVP